MLTPRNLILFALLMIVSATLVVARLTTQADRGADEKEHPDVVVNGPSGPDRPIRPDGAGLSDAQPSPTAQSPANRDDTPGRNVSLVGALRLEPFSRGAHADVAGYNDLAFVGKGGGVCAGTGVDIVDISDPTNPVKIAATTGHANTSAEDMQTIRIGTRDVLAVGLQRCRPGGTVGLELFDITNPTNPQLLSFFDIAPLGPGGPGVHEFDLTDTPSGRVLALLAALNLERESFSPPDPATGDLLILDITDPTNPTLAAEWGVLDEPALGPDFYDRVAQGADPQTLLHSAHASREGTLAYLSYWDAGVILLDISNPSQPVFLGRTAYAPDQEGNAHSVDLAQGGTILVQADEDFDPFHLEFRVTAPASMAGSYAAVEGAFTQPLATFPDNGMAGDVVHVGRGCPPGTPDLAEGDTYLADPAGKIALIERGVCPFDNKIAWAQINGAVGAIVYNHSDGGEGLLAMRGNNPVTGGSPDVIGTQITIPGALVRNSTGVAVVGELDLGRTVSVNMASVFDGWGFLRFFDVKDPANPVQIGTFATLNTTNPRVAQEGLWSVHNPEVRGNTVFASWYRDGVRVIDISRPSAPREVGSWTGAGVPADAPPVDIWSVVPHGSLLLASDRNYGLYVLKAEP